MPTIFWVDGYRVMILTHDHPPPHVHVLGGAGRAKVRLDCDEGTADLIWHEGIPRADLRRIIVAVEGEIERLCREWRKFHG